MIDHFRGILDSLAPDSVVIDVSGVGYRVSVPVSTAGKLPSPGREVKLFIVESVAMYGGAVAYYGFLTREERDLFVLLRDEVPGTGAKKALDMLDKVTKSLPEFARAIARRDADTLTGVFGFTRKTADKLIAALKDKLGVDAPAAQPSAAGAAAPGPREEAVAGLVSLGYKEPQARQAVEKALAAAGAAPTAADLIRRSLGHL